MQTAAAQGKISHARQTRRRRNLYFFPIPSGIYISSPNISVEPARNIFVNVTLNLTCDNKSHGPRDTNIELLQAVDKISKSAFPDIHDYNRILKQKVTKQNNHFYVSIPVKAKWNFFALYIPPLKPASCIHIISFTVWYKFCPGLKKGLAEYPEVEGAASRKTNYVKPGNCTHNAEPTSSFTDLYTSCSFDGVAMYNGSCQCQKGFQLEGNHCESKFQ